MLSDDCKDRLGQLLGVRVESGYRRGLFDAAQLSFVLESLDALASWFRGHAPERIRRADAEFQPTERFSERDALAIAYVDHVTGLSGTPAQQLQSFFNEYLSATYSHLHVLPHFPSPQIHEGLQGPAGRADGGFEAESYRMDPSYGEPSDLEAVDATLMFDFVLNHLSASGEWFQKFLENDPEFFDFFVTVPSSDIDISGVFRPRAHHPVVPFENSRGETKYVWCTFSHGQADLNLKNPRVFVALMRALIQDFLGAGAAWIRLDAVGYAIKMLGLTPDEPRTDCFGLPETHNVIKAMNCVLNELAPSAVLVAEVNATKDVIATYYGDGDEAHIAYEFPIAPLSLFTVLTGDATAVHQWCAERLAHPDRIGLAFTASHDGVGVLSMRDVPPLADGESALDFLARTLVERGAGINFKSVVHKGGPTKVPYEACITWAQAILSVDERERLLGGDASEVEIERWADRFFASHSFVLGAPHCVPADYLGAIVGLFNDEELALRSNHHRNKNRGVLNGALFAETLSSDAPYGKFVRRLWRKKHRALEVRRAHRAFSPYARCRVGEVSTGDGSPGVFSVYREYDGDRVLAVTNVTGDSLSLELSDEARAAEDLLEGGVLEGARLGPWQVAWLAL